MLPFYCTGKVCNRRPRCWVWVPKVHGDSEERGYALWESNQSGSEIGETPHKHVRHRGVKNAMAHSLFVSLRLPGRWPLKRNEAASIFRSQPRRHPSVLWWAWLFMGLLRLEDTGSDSILLGPDSSRFLGFWVLWLGQWFEKAQATGQHWKHKRNYSCRVKTSLLFSCYSFWVSSSSPLDIV